MVLVHWDYQHPGRKENPNQTIKETLKKDLLTEMRLSVGEQRRAISLDLKKQEEERVTGAP